MYSPRYREEPSISTCEEDRVLRKLTELNVNKYASTDHLVSCYSITAYVTSDHDQSILQHSRNIGVLDVDGFQSHLPHHVSAKFCDSSSAKREFRRGICRRSFHQENI